MPNEKYVAPLSKKEFLECGTYLKCYCPKCNLSLNQGDTAVFDIINEKGEAGQVRLSPYLCVFSRRSTISLPEGHKVKDLICPYCESTLIVENEDCGYCGSPVAKILIAALTKIIPFKVCTKVGCHWHGLSEADERLIQLDDCREW